jgi:hypothetical protein
VCEIIIAVRFCFYRPHVLFTFTQDVPDSKQYDRDVWSPLDKQRYNTHIARLQTYKNWPRWALKAPVEMSRAGFYNNGTYIHYIMHIIVLIINSAACTLINMYCIVRRSYGCCQVFCVRYKYP